MKTNFGAALTGLASIRLGFDRLTQRKDLHFEGSGDHARALKAAFKGKIKQPSVVHTSEGTQVLRPGKSGLFNLQAFQRVFKPPPQPVAQQPEAPAQGAAQVPEPPSSPVAASAPQEALPFNVRLHDATHERPQRLNDDKADWLHRGLAAQGAQAPAGATRQAAIARGRLEQRIADGMKELGELSASAVGSDLVAIQAARQEHAAAAIALALPELFHPPKDAAPDKPELERLQTSLLALYDRAITAGAKPPPSLERLAASFANQQSIREFADCPVLQKRNEAVVALTHLIDTVTRAVGPGRDGSSLNGLIGISGELDATLMALRVDATRNFMLKDAARPLTEETERRATADARAVVELEFSVAASKRMIQRTLEQSGTGESSGWTGHKVDTGLVKGLRKTLGASAKETALIVAGLMASERALAASPAGQRLLQDVQTELAAKRQERDRLTADMQHELRELAANLKERNNFDARGKDTRELDKNIRELETQLEPYHELGRDISYLEARARSLQTEASLASSRLAEAVEGVPKLAQQVRELEVQLQALINDGAAPPEQRGRLNADLTAAKKRLEMAENTMRHWAERSLAISVPPGLPQARDKVDEHDRTIKSLEQQVLALEATEATNAERNIVSVGNGPSVNALRTELAKAREQRDQAMQTLVDLQAQLDIDAHWGGLTPDELVALGLDAKDARDALDTARSLAKRGLTSAEQAAGMLSQVNSVMGALRAKCFNIEDSAGRTSDLLNAATNADRAKALSNALLHRLTGDVELAPLDERLKTLTEVAAHSERDNFDFLQRNRQHHAGLQRDLFDLTTGLEELQQRKAAAHDALRQFNAAAAGRKVDLDRPAGLQSSQRMREIIDLYRATDGLQTVSPDSKERKHFDELRNQLRGYDPNTLTTAWHGGAPLTIEQVVELESKPEFEAAIDAVICLRKDAPEMQSAIEAAITHTTAAMDATILTRGRLMGAAAHAAVRDATRAAILVQLEASSDDVAKFQPAQHAAEIKERLASWGVPLEEARPEIDSTLSQSFGPDELNLWVRQAAFTQLERAQIREDLSARAAESSKNTSAGGVRPETRKALLDGLDSLKVGEKVRLSAGDRVELQTGSIAVEPTGIVGVNVKLAVGQVDGLEIARLPDGYELVLRHGWDGKVGADVSAKVWKAKAFGLSAEANAGVEAAGFRVGGVTLRFPNTPEGRMAMKDVLESLLDKGRIEARDFCAADNVMAVVEKKIGAKVGAGAKVGFDYGTSSFKPAGSEYASVAIGARAAVSAGIAQTRSVTENAGLVIYKGEREVSVEASAAGGASWRLGAPAGAGKTHNVSSEALEASAAAALVYKVKSREVRGLDGLVKPGAQRVVQMYLPPKGKDRALGIMGGAEFRALVDRLQRSDRPEDRRKASELVVLLQKAGTNDTISIVSNLDGRILGSVNALLERAQAHRNGSITTGSPRERAAEARRLEDEAQALLDDPASYIIAKVWLAPTHETTKTLAPLNLLFARWNVYTEQRGEFVAKEILINQQLAREVHDAVRSGA